MKLGFIGTGNLASAILRGVVSAGVIKPDEIMIYDINAEKLSQLLGVPVVLTSAGKKQGIKQFEYAEKTRVHGLHCNAREGALPSAPESMAPAMVPAIASI